MSRIAVAAFIIGLLFGTSPAHAYLPDYLPNSLERKVRQIEQKCVLREIKNDSEATVGDWRMTNREDGFRIHGKSKDGSPWTVRTDAVGLGGNIWTGDFDANGVTDLVVLAASGGCGIAPPTRILTVLIDRQGMPHAYETVGYEYDTARGATDWVRIPGIEAGVLIQQDLTWVTGVKRDRTYWRFHLYRAENARIERLDGMVAGCMYPNFVWYTRKANHKLTATRDMLERTTRSQQNDLWKEIPVERN